MKKYHFNIIKTKKFNVLNDKNCLDYLHKWSMKGQIHLETFSFNESFESYKKNEFALDFFTSPEVMTTIAKILPNWSYDKHNIEDAEVETVPCTETSMAFFDPILDPKNNIVRQGGGLHPCAFNIINDFTVGDELRKMLIDEDSDNYGLYNEEKRREFLFRILLHLALGGKWCQYEDGVDPYLFMTKTVYKDLVHIERNSDTKEIQIRSLCVTVKLNDKQKKVVFPYDADNVQNFAYLIIDPVLRHVTLFAHEFGGSFN